VIGEPKVDEFLAASVGMFAKGGNERGVVPDGVHLKNNVVPRENSFEDAIQSRDAGAQIPVEHGRTLLLA
jgi:hypothetical protein